MSPQDVELLESLGWSVERASLYDEEGVEGWRWTGPDDREYTEVGDWGEPPAAPDAALEALAKAKGEEQP